MTTQGGSLDERAHESLLRQLNGENARLRHLADRYKEAMVVVVSCCLAFPVLLVWAAVPPWRRGHESELLIAAVAMATIALVTWLVAHLRLRRQIQRFWSYLPSLAASGVMVIESCPGIGTSQLRLQTQLPADDWPKWLHRKAGEVPSVSAYLWSLGKL